MRRSHTVNDVSAPSDTSSL